MFSLYKKHKCFINLSFCLNLMVVTLKGIFKRSSALSDVLPAALASEALSGHDASDALSAALLFPLSQSSLLPLPFPPLFPLFLSQAFPQASLRILLP